MAILINFVCSECNDVKREMSGPSSVPTVCRTCETKAAGETRARHMKGLEALSLEKRIQLLEQWIYDYKPSRELRF